jgi:arsenate reductase
MPSPVTTRPRVLFLCTGNAFRSQIGEGWLRHLASDRFEACSAGSHPAGFVHSLAVRVMQEAGVDISRQQSKSLDFFGGHTFDHVITVCDHAASSCPHLRGRISTQRWPMPDPSFVDDAAEALTLARRVRDELRDKIAAFVRQAAATGSEANQ